MEILIPRNTWEDKKAYDETAMKLRLLLNENFAEYAHPIDEANTPIRRNVA